MRSPMPGDGQAVTEAITESFNTLNTWMNWADHIPSVEESEEWARTARVKFLTREDLQFLIFGKYAGVFLGSIGLHRIDWKLRKFEIGYWIRDSASGKGYMTEAVQGLTQFATNFLCANRIEIRCDVRNTASRKVAERCGYHLEAIFLKRSVRLNCCFLAHTGSMLENIRFM
nr:GNAT family N-acetyltransferase [Alicyclobacillus macrosporangiidus]